MSIALTLSSRSSATLALLGVLVVGAACESRDDGFRRDNGNGDAAGDGGALADGGDGASPDGGDIGPGDATGVDGNEVADDGGPIDGDAGGGDAETSELVDITPIEVGDGDAQGEIDPDDGDTIDSDTVDSGGDTGGDVGPSEIVECGTLPPVSSGVCDVALGSGVTILRGTVLGDGVIWEGGEVVYDVEGRIACAGCDCAGEVGMIGATVVTCTGAVISPGLINAHDHITFTYNTPGSWGTERYEHRHDWRKGHFGHTRISAPGMANGREIAWGELRQVMAGTTSLAGSGSTRGWLRNLDSTTQQEGIDQTPVEYQTFPLGDGSVSETQRTDVVGTCGYPEYDDVVMADEDCYLAHVSEGINAEARNEFLCLSSTDRGGHDFLGGNSAFVHGIGVGASDVLAMAAEGASLVWSPRSNISLYGHTAPVVLYANLGVNIALGTDWTPSGSVHMLRELRCADEYNATQLGGFFSDEALWRMATVQAAEALAVDDVVGSLRPGLFADIAVFDGRGFDSPYRAIIDGDVSRVALVLRGGVPLYGDTDILEALPGAETGCEPLPGGVCGVTKSVCVQRETAMAFADLAAENVESYGLFFCGVPDGEPTCVPSREGEFDGASTLEDADGDGIDNDADNCPGVFNPVRLLDGGSQPDADGDGDGDACDSCPFHPGTETCARPDPDDLDNDGLPNVSDNCPSISNPLQEDGDADGAGDLCDRCPAFANPGDTGCPATIYEVKRGERAVGEAVIVDGVVTHVFASGIQLQVPAESQDADLRVRWSGVRVYVPESNPAGLPIPIRGAHVRVTGIVNGYFGRTEIGAVSEIEVLTAPATIPLPVVVSPSVVATGAADGEAFEGALVCVIDQPVSDAQAPPGPGDTAPTDEYIVADALYVGDEFFTTSPYPIAGDRLTVIGLLTLSRGENKLAPRDGDDIEYTLYTPPQILGFDTVAGATESWVRAGTGVTPVPPLRILLDREAGPDGFAVDVATSAGTIASVDSPVRVAPGSSAVVLRVEALVAGETTLSLPAAVGSDSALLHVMPAGSPPQAWRIEPDPLTVPMGRSVTATLFVDVPAGAGGISIPLLNGEPGSISVSSPVAIAEGATSGAFTVTGLAESSTAWIDAGGLGDLARVPVIVGPELRLGLILSEIFYNPTSTDSGFEWIELYNDSDSPLDLAAWSLGAGGTDFTYSVVPLAGTVSPRGCFVVGGPSTDATNFSPVYDQVFDFSPDLQNSGSTADGVAVFDGEASGITPDSVPHDAVIYGGANTNNLPDETGAPGTPRVGDAGTAKSIERLADGSWRVQSAPSPGNCAPLGP